MLPLRPRGKVLYFRHADGPRDASFARASQLSAVENWRATLRLSYQTLHHLWPAPHQRGPRQAICWQQQAEESATEFQARVTREKETWTFSRRTAPH